MLPRNRIPHLTIAWLVAAAAMAGGEQPDDPRSARDAGWESCRIDQFILARMQAAGLKPSPPADRRTMLRRVTYDLTGLPPTPEEIAEFLCDDLPDAYAHVVERLLASPHYGERWGRHWLDAARYADSAGFESDAPRSVWKYRDWVIASLNADLPFDQFTIEQLAGDLLPEATTEQRIATGFLLNGIQDGASEPSRYDAVVDRLNTVGEVFLGLTLGCAQCHSHKFDPISQEEYFRLFAFINTADETPLELAGAEDIARRDALRGQLVQLERERDEYARQLAPQLPDWEAALSPEDRARLSGPAKTAIIVPANERNAEQQLALLAELGKLDPGYCERRKCAADLAEQIPHLPTTPVLRQSDPPRTTHVFHRGEFSQPTKVVSPGVPAMLIPLASEAATRMDFARWLVSRENTRTARVAVNRVWQAYFGVGMVATAGDFGSRGDPPSHPELLDWLAAEFVARGYSLKALHRLIVTSATYRQSSRFRSDAAEIDPANRMLTRQNRLRLEAEIIRDATLAVSGLLSRKIGGPSVYPYQPPGIMENRATPAPWVESPAEDAYRRGLYTHFWRLTPHPFLQTFDAPDAVTACTARKRTNTPLQALSLLNDPAHVECARGLAKRVLRECGAGNDEKIAYAFVVCLGRRPTQEETAVLAETLHAERASFTIDGEAARQVAGPSSLEWIDVCELAAWTEVARTLFNVEEFIVRE